MAHPQDQLSSRRTFLKGAAGVFATTASGGMLAQAVGFGTATVSLAWWDGERLIPADALPSSHDIETATVSFRGYGEGGLRSIDALFPISAGKGEQTDVSFRAWTPAPHGVALSRCTQVVGPALRFDVGVTGFRGAGTASIRLIQGKDPGNKLREGTYVLAQGTPAWSSYRLDMSQMDAPLRVVDGGPATLSYVLLDIQRA